MISKHNANVFLSCIYIINTNHCHYYWQYRKFQNETDALLGYISLRFICKILYFPLSHFHISSHIFFSQQTVDLRPLYIALNIPLHYHYSLSVLIWLPEREIRQKAIRMQLASSSRQLLNSASFNPGIMVMVMVMVNRPIKN